MKDAHDLHLAQTLGRLSGLFEKSDSIEGFLREVADGVASFLEADTCTVLLVDEERGELLLSATSGGRDTRFARQLREGTGLVTEVLRQQSPRIGEEADEAGGRRSVAAVPIRRGPVLTGVIVLEHHRPGHFDEGHLNALKTVASHLAATLENATLLIEIRDRGGVRIGPSREAPALVTGRSVSEGIALGQLFPLVSLYVVHERTPRGLPPGGSPEQAYRSALEASKKQLELLQSRIERDSQDLASFIFSSHLLMLNDDDFAGEILRKIQGGLAPAAAVIEVVNRYAGLFSRMEDPRFQEKAQDVRDVGHRILANLEGIEEETADYHGHVVLAADLYPSELVKLAVQNVEGIAYQGTTPTAHISILARSLGVPVLATEDPRLADIPPGTFVLLDATGGRLHVESRERLRKQFDTLAASAEPPACTPEEEEAVRRMGVRVMANINLLAELGSAAACRADGIGLYRSEFPFILRYDFPSEEEQYLIYRKIVQSMPEGEVILRTFDLGGDKLMPSWERESNPFLGVRGIRFSLSRRELFRDQLRAMLRAGAGAGARLGIMFPMISSVDEYLEAREELRQCRRDLAREGVEHNASPRIGAMVELPSAVEAISELAQEADFLSIGTNDLVMYLLAVDRTNERLGKLYLNHHPMVLRALKRIVDGVGERIGELSACGDAASYPSMSLFLTGLGIRKLSVDPRHIPRVRKRLAAYSLEQAEKIAAEMLSIVRVADIEEYVRSLG
jgi:phosphotransferase system enzyme I (PtsP)